MLFESLAYAMGGVPTGGGTGGAGGNPLMGMAPLVIMFVIFYFLLIRPQQKKAKQHRELLGNLKRGDYVITGGGLYGRIEAVNGDILTIDLGETKVKINRSFVSGLAEAQTKEPKESKESKKESKKESGE